MNLRSRLQMLFILIAGIVSAGTKSAQSDARSSEGLLISSTPIKLKDRKLPDRADKCQDCHRQKSSPVFPRQGRPVKEHGEISNVHGKVQVSCHQCHDPNNSDFLRSGYSDEFKSSFKNSSPVCSTCHAAVFQSWREGLHGKRLSAQVGVREQLHCIDCHEPHSVTFKKMRAIPPPQRPKFLIEKESRE